MRNLILLSILCLLGSCRAVLKNKSSADSTAVRTSNSNDKFTREIIREYLHDTTAKYMPGPAQVITVDRPYPVAGPTLIRETIREAGESQKASTEEKAVSVEEKKVEKEATPWWVWLVVGMGGLLMLTVLGLILFLVNKIRNIPASIITKTIT